MNARILTTVAALGIITLAMHPTRVAAEDGAAVFKAQCAKCHGETGQSDTPAGKTLKVPQFKGDAKVAAMSLEDIAKAAKDNPKHKSFITKLTDEQISAAAGVAKQLAGGK